MKAFLKWAGGKTKVALEIQYHFKSGRRLVEPFVGSGALFLNTCFDEYLLCDTNSDLIGLYNNLKTSPDKLIDITASFFTRAYNTESKFYELREEFNSLRSNDIEKSAIFIYLNRHAFNGLCRYNRKGFFNVPYGRYKKPRFPIEEMEQFAIKAQSATFKCQDFEATFRETKSGDIIYCDPPYVPLSGTASFTAYSKNVFDFEDQLRLVKNATKSRTSGIQCVISNHDLDITRKIYEKSDIHKISVMRNIASKPSSRKRVNEIIAVY